MNASNLERIINLISEKEYFFEIYKTAGFVVDDIDRSIVIQFNLLDPLVFIAVFGAVYNVNWK